jgi:hypothetical protein
MNAATIHDAIDLIHSLDHASVYEVMEVLLSDLK